MKNKPKAMPAVSGNPKSLKLILVVASPLESNQTAVSASAKAEKGQNCRYPLREAGYKDRNGCCHYSRDGRSDTHFSFGQRTVEQHQANPARQPGGSAE